jgi:hypothetical protein
MQRVLLIGMGIVMAAALVAGAQEVNKLEPVVVTATKTETQRPRRPEGVLLVPGHRRR